MESQHSTTIDLSISEVSWGFDSCHCKSSTSSAMARKRPRPSEGSRYTACPACGRTIAFLLLNAHLDACTAPADAQSGGRQEPDGSCAPAAPTAKVPQVLAAGRTPVAFARQDGRKMPLTDEQLAALTPCEVRLPCCMHLPWICHACTWTG